jgi:hypothetical protein
MQDKELYQELLDEVMYNIHQDLSMRDVEALEELLKFCPIQNLIGYLPEEDSEKFKPLLNGR